MSPYSLTEIAHARQVCRRRRVALAGLSLITLTAVVAGATAVERLGEPGGWALVAIAALLPLMWATTSSTQEQLHALRTPVFDDPDGPALLHACQRQVPFAASYAGQVAQQGRPLLLADLHLLHEAWLEDAGTHGHPVR